MTSRWSQTKWVAVWSLLVLCCALYLGFSFTQGIRVETSVLDLLPKDQSDPIKEAAVAAVSEQVQQKVVFLLGHGDTAQAIKAADSTYERMVKSALFEDIQYQVSASQTQEIYQFYWPYRLTLFSDQFLHWLQIGDFSAMTTTAMKRLYNPTSVVNADLLAQDPLFQLVDFLQNIASASGGLTMVQQRLWAKQDDLHYVFIQATLKNTIFSLQTQTSYQSFFQELKGELTLHSNVRLLSTGAIYYAAAGVASAKQEISTIGLGSLLGVIILVVLVFKSIRPLGFAVLSVSVGVMFGLSACLLIFGGVHLMTLIFGASLIGVSIDYTFHYFTERSAVAHDQVIPNIRAGLTLGLVSSCIGYLALSAAPFPGLQQMAAFSSVGLIAAFFSVVIWYPRLVTMQIKPLSPVLLRRVVAVSMFWRRLPLTGVYVLVSVLLMTSVGILFFANSNDDVRGLQHRPADLLQQDNKIKSIMKLSVANQFYLVTAHSAEAVLAKQKQMLPVLAELKRDGALGGYVALLDMIPDASTQNHAYQILRTEMLSPTSVFMKYFNQLGFDDLFIETMRQQYRHKQPQLLTVDHWQNSSLVSQFPFLWLGKIQDQFVAVVALTDVQDLNALASAELPDGVQFVDYVEDISNVFAKYRDLVTLLVIAAYGIILLLLIIRYRWLQVLLIILPPVLAAVLSLAILTLAGVALNLFMMLALMLVLGIGIDYTLFLTEHPESQSTTLVAILLSAVTTMLSFGLLALSDMPVLQGIGLVVLLGIFFSTVFAPLACLAGIKKREA
ncbi:MAG: hypothetical protein HN790_04535 [Methylococcales bacterium]|nr:hypothetical protein [Methylococcales bacterium]